MSRHGRRLATTALLFTLLAVGPVSCRQSSTPRPTLAPASTGTATAAARPPAELAAVGAQLFVQFGCRACHSTTGQPSVGPPPNGIYGTEVRLADGSTVTVDDAYLRESILQPDAKTVEGFQKGVMLGAIGGRLDEIQQGDNLDALVEYIKSLE